VRLGVQGRRVFTHAAARFAKGWEPNPGAIRSGETRNGADGGGGTRDTLGP